MSNKLGVTLNPERALSTLISSEGFDRLSEENKKVVIKKIGSVQEGETDGGITGKIIGIKKDNMSFNIAFWICAILLLFCLADIIRSIAIGNDAYTNLVKNILPILSLTLGYMLGQKENNK